MQVTKYLSLRTHEELFQGIFYTQALLYSL